MDDRTTEKPIVTSENRARAGVTGHNVRYVLLVGTTLVALAFAAIWWHYFA